MKTVRRLALLVVTFVAAYSCGCRTNTVVRLDNTSLPPKAEPTKTAPARLTGSAETEVTFYPTYGYRNGESWRMQLRGWAHEDQSHLNKLVGRVARLKQKCAGPEIDTFQSRSDDFMDDDDFGERVVIKFDGDPADGAYVFERRSSLNGIVTLDVTLTDEKAGQLLERQGSPNGWLTYRAVSGGHGGIGRVRLIEPEGVSLVSDIDDTIKVTEVPACVSDEHFQKLSRKLAQLYGLERYERNTSLPCGP